MFFSFAIFYTMIMYSYFIIPIVKITSTLFEHLAVLYLPFILIFVLTFCKTLLMRYTFGGELIFIPSTYLGLLLVNVTLSSRKCVTESLFPPISILAHLNLWELHLYPEILLPKSSFTRVHHLIKVIDNISKANDINMSFLGLTPVKVKRFVKFIKKPKYCVFYTTYDKAKTLFYIRI